MDSNDRKGSSAWIFIQNYHTSHIFYIIKYLPTGRYYAGAKWEIGCNPKSFMTYCGYTTSSDDINDLIITDGLESFEIIQIITDFSPFSSAYEYESDFLQSNDIANNDNWFNKHNNLGIVYGSKEFRNSMIQKYGAEYPQQVEEIRIKTKITNNEKYGADNVFGSKIIQEKSRQTCLEKYGVEFSFQSEIVKNKAKETNMNNIGVEYHSQTTERRNKLSQLSTGSTYWNDGVNEFKITKDGIPDPN